MDTKTTALNESGNTEELAKQLVQAKQLGNEGVAEFFRKLAENKNDEQVDSFLLDVLETHQKTDSPDLPVWIAYELSRRRRPEALSRLISIMRSLPDLEEFRRLRSPYWHWALDYHRLLQLTVEILAHAGKGYPCNCEVFSKRQDVDPHGQNDINILEEQTTERGTRVQATCKICKTNWTIDVDEYHYPISIWRKKIADI